MTKQKKVSMIMPCFNSAPYVDTMLASIFAQTYDNIEMIIGYDESTDDTLRILESWKGRFIEKGYGYQIIHNMSNAGIPGGINAALPYFTGDYITFPDSDDYMYPEFVSTLVSALEENPQFNWARPDSIVVKESTPDKVLIFDYAFDQRFQSLDIALCFLLRVIPTAIWRIMARAEFFLKVFPDRVIYPHPISHELPVDLPLAVAEPFLPVSVPLYKYIVHELGYVEARSKSLHKRIPYLDSCATMAKEVIMQLPITPEQKERYFLASDITTFTKKAEAAIQFSQPVLACVYIERLFEAIRKLNPELMVSGGFDPNRYRRVLVHSGCYIAVGIYADRETDLLFWKMLNQHGRVILWGAGRNCFDLMTMLDDQNIQVLEIWDVNADNIKEKSGKRVLLPHKGADEDAIVVITIGDDDIYADIYADLSSMGYSNIFTFWEVMQALRFGMITKYFPSMCV